MVCLNGTDDGQTSHQWRNMNPGLALNLVADHKEMVNRYVCFSLLTISFAHGISGLQFSDALRQEIPVLCSSLEG